MVVSREGSITSALANSGRGSLVEPFELERRMLNAEGPISGNTWYVDTVNGVDTNQGFSLSDAFLTMAAAYSAASAGDTIYFIGTLTETLALAKANISIIGLGPTPNSNVWMENAADDDLVTVTAANCRLANIRFRIPTTGGRGVVITSGADYLRVIDCHFQGRGGSHHAITNDGSADNIRILNNVFLYNNTATDGCAIFGHTFTADVVGSGWIIAGNHFHSNLRHIFTRLRQSLIINNFFQEKGLDTSGETALTSTVKLNLSGTLSKWNTVTQNVMQGDYSNTGGYEAGTEDNWFGNLSDDTSESEVTAEGTTTAVPAA